MIIALLGLAFVGGCNRPRDSGALASIPAGATITITLDRELADSPYTLRFRANAGQSLLVVLANLTWMSDAPHQADGDKLSVIPPGDRQSERLPTRPGDDHSPGSFWMNTLPKNGVYQFVVDRPFKNPYRLQVTLMDAHDPILDPGISPDKVSIDLSAVAPGKLLSLQPFNPPVEGTIDDFWPAHLGLLSENLVLRIISMDGLRKIDRDHGGDGWVYQLDNLQLALGPGARPISPKKLPLAGYGNAAIYFWGRQEFIEGKNWRGLRWIAKYQQDTGSLSNPLAYMVQAITRDGRHFIHVYTNVEYVAIPGELARPIDQGQWDERPRLFEAFQDRVRRALDSAAPTSFKPDLNQLDAAVRSLELR